MYVKIYRNSFMKHVNEGIQNIYNIGALTVNIEFMWQGLETGEKISFSESFHPFCAEPHNFLYLPSIHQYCIYPAIEFLTKKKLFNLKIKKDNGNPIDTSIVVPVRGVA